jgi:group I intron endonuclease
MVYAAPMLNRTPTMRLNLHRAEWRPVGSVVAGTYRIKNMVNGKVYNGSSANVSERLAGHRHALVEGTHYNRHLQGAFNKYGADAFVFEPVDEVAVLFRTLTSEQRMCLRPQLVYAEQVNIDRDESWKQEKGYNLAARAGSPLGVKHSEETRRKIRKYQNRPDVAERKRQRMLGWHPTEEQRERMAVSHLGAKHTEESKRKTTTSLLSSEKFHAAMASAEVRQKISANQKRRFEDPNERRKTSEATLNAHQIPWSTGLTKETDPRLVWTDRQRQEVGDRMRGMKFSEERKQHMSEGVYLAHLRRMLAGWS